MEFWNIKEETETEKSFKIAAYFLAFITGIIGNILVIIIVLRKAHFKTTTNLFIINMAFSDLLMVFACMPSTMYSIGAKSHTQTILRGTFGSFACKFIPFAQGLSIAVSILTLTILACNRFLAIVYPFLNLISKSRAKILIGAIWFISFCFNAPFLYIMRFSENNGEATCRENWEPHFDDVTSTVNYTIILFVFLYAVPLVLISFFYAALVRELWLGSRLHSNQTRAFSENKSVLKMVLTVVIVFALSWLPGHVIMFYVLFTDDQRVYNCGVKPSILFVGYFMGHASTALSPVIYFIFNESFRREVLVFAQSLFRRCVKTRQVVSERNPGSRCSATRQTQGGDSSSNDDKSTAGKGNDAFEMVSETGTTNV